MTARMAAGRDGFTLVEVMAAMSIIAIALVGLAAALQQGLSGIETGRGQTVAVFLVEEKLEEIRGLALVDWANPVLQPGTMTEYCGPRTPACSTIAAPGAWRRTTTVTGGGASCPGQCKVVMVSVFYRPLTAGGQLDQERRVDVGAMFVPRA